MANQCPVCNETLQPDQTECPRCGFKLVGKTQVFKPVSAAGATQAETRAKGLPALEIVSGPYAGETFPLGTGSFTLGRDPKCDIFLSNMTVSRHHATIVVDADGARITDAGSLNGTWVDGKVVDEAPLSAGTRVQIGTFDMVFKYVTD